MKLQVVTLVGMAVSVASGGDHSIAGRVGARENPGHCTAAKPLTRRPASRRFRFILSAQAIVVMAFCCWPLLRLMGRDYDAAVTESGFVGFMLGTTANAVAVMSSLTERFGPAPRALAPSSSTSPTPSSSRSSSMAGAEAERRRTSAPVHASWQAVQLPASIAAIFAMCDCAVSRVTSLSASGSLPCQCRSSCGSSCRKRLGWLRWISP